MLLLNLAVIPDEVIRGTDETKKVEGHNVIKEIDFNPGWSKRFMKSMTDYKENWNKLVADPSKPDHQTEWRYQDNDLEEDYQKFVIQKYETDIKLHDDTIAF